MKKVFRNCLLLGTLLMSTVVGVQAEHLVFIAVNDTHSQIDPASDGQGGLLRRRAIFDKVRSDNKYTLTVHAGDAVQGTTFFSLYGGEVEYALMDSLGYDVIILGNHEFDNGLDSIYYHYKNIKAEKLCANYDFSATKLHKIFKPYYIKAVGDKRVGVFGINIEPKGLIADKNYPGLRYIRSIDVADATARYLKETLGCDYAVMVSHIGYDSYNPTEPNDTMIIRNSHYIDLVIGGHSHTVIKPGSEFAQIPNADGRLITVGQNGKSGKLVGVYDLDLDNGKVEYSQIKVDNTWDKAAENYPELKAWIGHYRNGVDSLMNHVVGRSVVELPHKSDLLTNWVSDITLDIIKDLSGYKVDLAIMNKGGIRCAMPAGDITEGLIDSMFPFDNRYMVLEMSGKDLLEALGVMAGRGGDALSRGMMVTYDKSGKVLSAKLNGKKIDPKKMYKVATIDYLANGGDYMVPLTRAKRLYEDEQKYGIHVLNYVKELTAAGKQIKSVNEQRMQCK